MKQSSSSVLPWLSSLALASMLAAQGVQDDPAFRSLDRLPGRLAERLVDGGPALPPGTVVFDQPGDGRIWALGSTYKASFGADGFVYVPFFGSQAPTVYPVRFVLRAVRVGGRDLPFTAEAPATRHETRVTFDRGAVREIYDLGPSGVEQTFVVDGTTPGDVDVELEVVTALVEDPAQPGLQFGNQFGHVAYGTAYLVTGEAKSEIPATFAGRTLSLRVPAAQRRAGPVVIDPVVNTYALTPTQKRSENPDVAYDATTDRWAIAWVNVFAETDHDVVAEVRQGSGEPIAGSYVIVDTTTMSHSWPRIANLNSADRFLIVMERYIPANPIGQQYTIWGRTLNAAAPFAMSTLVQVSPPALADQLSADVGGDSGNGTNWMVVWRHGTDIHARQVSASGTPAANTIPIETTPSACISPQISLSNGNGLTANPRWCVVYTLQRTQTNWDIYGAVLDVTGSITKAHSVINNSSGNDLYTYVSSPIVDGRNGPAFLVSYERQGSEPEMIVQLVDAGLQPVGAEANLTRRYGFSGIYSRVESDGSRFAAVCQTGTQLRVGTLAPINGDLVLHESPVPINTGHSPHLASKRSGGGGSTDYAIVFVNPTVTPPRASLSLYQGRAPSGGFSRRGTNCGLGINNGGLPYLGQTMTFTLSNTGTDVAVLLLGAPAPEVALCSTCRLGLDLTAPILAFVSPMALPVPRAPMLVGVKVAVQGLALGSGPCLPGRLRLSDTVDATIQ